MTDSAQKSRVLVGSLAYTGYTTSFEMPNATEMLPTTTLIDTAPTFIPGAEMPGVASFGLLLDSDGAVGGQFSHATLFKGGVDQPLTYAPFGSTAGAIALMVAALEASYGIESSPTGAVKALLAVQCNSITECGVMIDDLTAITADTSGASVDNAAASSNGGVAHLHVTAFSGFTSDSVIIEHSVDNSIWATLATATLVAGKTSERVTVAAGTTVRRYMRIRDDVTGTGSVTRSVSFARR